ncbi:MAG: peptidoglycan-binding domain-containing protein [Prochlorothrix sp.]|nr:peptidoglycan-binding domain-containing protein [Prochlorothrix sp.]
METLAYLHLTVPESTPSPARRPPRSTAPDSDFAQTRSLTLPGVIGAGLVGMATFAPLSAQAQASLSQGSSGPAVEELQEQLAALGYFDATATGYYGSITEEAVLRFQTDRGLFVDGVAGPATLEALPG